MRRLRTLALLAALALPLGAAPTVAAAQTFCPPGVLYVICLCTAHPEACYPGTYILKPR